MDQTVVSHSSPSKGRNRLGCIIAVVIVIGGFAALTVLGGAAYFLGYFSPTSTETQTTTPTEQLSLTQPSAITEVPLSVEAPTQPAALETPTFQPYQAGRGVQYPTLEELSDGAGNVKILPGQPTILEIRWCADAKPKLSEINNVLDVTLLVDGAELAISSFDFSMNQEIVEIYAGKKVPAFCSVMSGITRDWTEGDHVVNIKVLAKKDYDDGWKTHPQGETIQTSYYVLASPSATPVEWNRCLQFEGLTMDVVFTEWRATQPLEYYFKVKGGIPGLEKTNPSDTQPWIYTSKIEDSTSGECSFQGYAERLYCSIENPPSGFSNTTRPLSLNVNGCSWPIYFNPIEVMPELKK